MSFFEDVNSCMSSSGLPAPREVLHTLGEALEFLHHVREAWEYGGGETEMTLAALVALGAATGIDEVTLAILGAAVAESAEITVEAYLLASMPCVVAAAGSSIRRAIAAVDDPWLKDQLLAQADEQDIPVPTANA